STPEAARRAFVAGAARPTAPAKAEYFRRYLDDPALNEEWVTASVGAFNDPAHAALTRAHLRPALERLEWIRENRRIFFLPRWIEAFLRGHTDAGALAEVDAFLAAHPELPLDIRRKVLQARDELERTVRIRERT
ncbi:MAG: aminopeptidase, partial [Gemmatimonadota bacterium]|nr:aminopeptidase [Gemmatimonadota bacterium]